MKLSTALAFFILSFHLNAAEEWRTPKPANLVYVQLESGIVIIELAPFMAPLHVAQFKALVKEGFYNDLDFYRVIDGFVAQGGDVSEKKASKHRGNLLAEFTRNIPDKTSFMLVQSPDIMAPQTGFLHGFAAGQDPKTKEEWLLHCPGALAMARNAGADTGSTDFYIVIGQATRHLDRNMSTFGRVIYGMPLIQSLQRAHVNNASGVIDDAAKRGKIISAKLATDIPVKERLNIQVQNQHSKAVEARLSSARKLDNEFFHFKGNGNLDVCYYQLRSRVGEQ
jgi:peptidylprolyl isomerase